MITRSTGSTCPSCGIPDSNRGAEERSLIQAKQISGFLGGIGGISSTVNLLPQLFHLDCPLTRPLYGVPIVNLRPLVGMVRLFFHFGELTPKNRSINGSRRESQPSCPSQRILYAIVSILAADAISFRFIVRGEDIVAPFLGNLALAFLALLLAMYGGNVLLECVLGRF
jgi:hypothetical protein